MNVSLWPGAPRAARGEGSHAKDSRGEAVVSGLSDAEDTRSSTADPFDAIDVQFLNSFVEKKKKTEC